MDRQPKAAPFPVGTPVGTHLRYNGKHENYSIKRHLVDGTYVEEHLPIAYPGMEVTITRVTKPHRGTLEQLRDEDGLMYDDQGEPVLDDTEDSHSVYDSPGGGRLIRWDSDWRDWLVLNLEDLEDRNK